MAAAVVRAVLAPGLVADADLFAGIVTANLTEAAWENDGVVRAVFDRVLTDDEARAVERKMVLTDGVKARVADKSVTRSYAPTTEPGVVDDVWRVEVNGVIAEEYVANDEGDWVGTPSATVATALSGQRVVIDLDGFRAYNAANQIVTAVMSANGDLTSSRALFTSTAPASTAAGNVPALRIGAPAGRHLRADGNDILAMDSGSVQGELWLNTGGLTRVTDINVLGQFNTPTKFNNAIYSTDALTLRSTTPGGTVTGELQVRGGSNIRGKLANTGQPDAGGVALTFLDTRVGVTTAGMNAADFTSANTQSFVANQITAFQGLFDNSQSGGGSDPAVFNAGGRLVRGGGSSRRVKYVDGPLDLATAQKILKLQPVRYRYKAEADEFGDRAVVYPGFVAEDVDDAGLGLWVSRDAEGRPARVRYAEMSAAHLLLIRDLYDQVKALRAQVKVGLT